MEAAAASGDGTESSAGGHAVAAMSTVATAGVGQQRSLSMAALANIEAAGVGQQRSAVDADGNARTQAVTFIVEEQVERVFSARDESLQNKTSIIQRAPARFDREASIQGASVQGSWRRPRRHGNTTMLSVGSMTSYGGVTSIVSAQVTERNRERGVTDLLGVNRCRECPIFFFECSAKNLYAKLKAPPVDPDAPHAWTSFHRPPPLMTHSKPFHALGLTFRDIATERHYQKDWARRSKTFFTAALFFRILIGLTTTIWYIFENFTTGGRVDWNELITSWNLGHANWRLGANIATTVLYTCQFILQVCFRKVFLRHFVANQTLWALVHVLVIVGVATAGPVPEYDICQHSWDDIFNISNSTYRDSAIYATHLSLTERHWGLAFVFLTSFEFLLMYRLPFLTMLYMVFFLCFGSLFISGEYRNYWCSDCVCRLTFDEAGTLVVLLSGELVLTRILETLNRLDFAQSLTAFEENKRSDRLLANILPVAVIEQLKEAASSLDLQCRTDARRTVTRQFARVSLLFADLCGFTAMSARVDAETLVGILNVLFGHFDEMCEKHTLEKIKTIGDCYMVAGGVPIENDTHHVDISRMGLDMVELLESGAITDPSTGEPLQVRVGCHAGPVTAGVIGEKKFLYDLWGDAVNTASRMESHGKANRVHCTRDLFKLIKGSFKTQSRGEMLIKGKGNMRTYFILAENSKEDDE